MSTAGRRGSSFSRRYSPRDRRAIGIAVIGLGIFGFIGAINLFHLNSQFDGPTTKVIGSVEGLYPSQGRYKPHIAYGYPIGNVVLHTEGPVDRKVFKGLNIGDPLPVKYLPGDPTANRIDIPAENEERHQAAYVLAAMAIIFICAGTYGIGQAYRDHPSMS